MEFSLKIKGGRQFNFIGLPPIKPLNKIATTVLSIQLVSERFNFHLKKPLKQSYKPFEPFAFLNNDIPLSLPFDIELLEHKENSDFISFTPKGKIQKIKGNLSPKEKWIKGNGYLQVLNLLTREGIDPNIQPSRLFISCFSTQPFTVDIKSTYKKNSLLDGIKSFITIFEKSPSISILLNDKNGQLASDARNIAKQLPNIKVDLIFLENKYPTQDGTIPLYKGLYPFDFDKNRNNYWIMDLISLDASASIISHGIVKNSPIVIGGSNTTTNGYYEVSPWNIHTNITKTITKNQKIILGGLLTGIDISNNKSFPIRPWDRGISIIDNPKDREMLHFIRPGYRKDSFSPTFLSWFFPKVKKDLHGGIRGEKRFCISCNYCEKICPVGLDPQILWKLCKTDLLEEASELGLLRCSDCGLCSYVCPSKIEISKTINESRLKWIKEL
jgi:Na(+)-translocating NADH:ubiquinone oxidoreductase A subunit